MCYEFPSNLCVRGFPSVIKRKCLTCGAKELPGIGKKILRLLNSVTGIRRSRDGRNLDSRVQLSGAGYKAITVHKDHFRFP